MGAVRKWAPHRRWTDTEIAVLREMYATVSLPEIEGLLPGRDRRMIQCKANGLGLVRQRAAKRTPDQVRAAKRAHMANKRAADPEAARAYQNGHRAKHRERINAKTRADTARRLFWARALRLRNGITARDLARLWKRQRGLCALTGARLDRTAEIDHKTPRARGGADVLENLQWVTPVANRAKRDLTDAEFLTLCQTCVRWIGRRIAAALQLRAAA